jgi:hypothetical protein
VFWLGDLNYRINGNSKAVRHLMRSRLHEVLHANDQLRLQQKMGTVFQVGGTVAVGSGWSRGHVAGWQMMSACTSQQLLVLSVTTSAEVRSVTMHANVTAGCFGG